METTPIFIENTTGNIPGGVMGVDSMSGEALIIWDPITVLVMVLP